MFRYRITKYDPKFRDISGHYLKNTWTSFSDIGKTYEGKKATVSSYLKIEKMYIDAIITILKFYNVSNFKICDLELYSSVEKINNFLKTKELKLSSQDIVLINSLEDNKTYLISELEKIITLILRECFWCRLVSESPLCIIEFGYDLYVYISLNIQIDQNIIANFKEKGIYIECVMDFT